LSIDVGELISGFDSGVLSRPLRSYALRVEMSVRLQPPDAVVGNQVFALFLEINGGKDNTGDRTEGQHNGRGTQLRFPGHVLVPQAQANYTIACICLMN
jgi:hypothetical protein